ncbi:hypothetical protein KAW38_02105 [Candidatus Micrarchaeota archaeon]|nr:hypothetical protein [Candidatus Micrarchaeota archaeon]
MKFKEGINEAIKIEKDSLPYEQYKGDLSFESKVDLSPKDIVEMDFHSFLHLYNRIEKIMKALRFEKEFIEKKPKKVAKEVENIERDFKKITSTTTSEVKEMQKIVEEKPEFEKPEELKKELEKLEMEEKPEEEEKVSLGEHHSPIFSIPPLLRLLPEEEAEKTISAIDVSLEGETKLSHPELKKKMFQLTRELLKTKSNEQRVRLRGEITKIKIVLTTSGKKATDLVGTLKLEQEKELKQAKDRLVSWYKHMLEDVNTSFGEDLSLGMDEGKALEYYRKDAEKLKSHVAKTVGKYKEFIVAKHHFEIDKMAERHGELSAQLLGLKGVVESYESQFAESKNTLSREIDGIISSKETAVKGKEKGEHSEEIAGINEKSDSELLTYLQSNDLESYEKYAKGELLRSQALIHAKKLLARESGIDEETINKYFG